MSRHNQTGSVSQRQLKVGEQIRQALSEIIIKRGVIGKDLKEISITISEVRVTSDLRVAHIFVLPFCSNINKETFLSALKQEIHFFRSSLNRMVKLKYSPELIFHFDDSFDNAQKIEQLINKVADTENHSDE